MDDARLVYITAVDAKQALAIGRILVEERLAACVNVLPGMTSLYRWQGVVEQAPEAVLIAKTRAGLVAGLGARVRALHSYRTPCILELAVVGGDADYLAWLLGECG